MPQRDRKPAKRQDDPRARRIPPGRPRFICYHEAGHCLARWYFGHMTDRASVLTTEQFLKAEWPVSRGGTPVPGARGICVGYEIVSPWLAEVLRNSSGDVAVRYKDIYVSVEVELIICSAGPFAEARFRKHGKMGIFLGGGLGDLSAAERVSNTWFPEAAQRRRAEIVADKRASALIRSHQGWHAITAMAEALFVKGEIDGDEIESLCAAAYGQSTPRFGSWNKFWPPETKAIRAGCLPP